MVLAKTMKIPFHKYQGTGNDFVIIDNRQSTFPKNDTELVSRLCNRKFGIGADGCMLLENDEMSDFRMVYYNSDGREGTMCGNGGRCLVAYAAHLGVIGDSARFMAVDGMHKASLDGPLVTLQMKDVDEVLPKRSAYFLDTGSPHHVQLVSGLGDYDVYLEGQRIRYGLYGQKGSNVNFVEQEAPDRFFVRTYERGVEDETLSCGTGVTAVAVAMYESGKTGSNKVKIGTRGGVLEVKFDKIGTGYRNITLTGPAEMVFKGEVIW